MKREREPIPKTRSSFVLVKCPDCKEESILFTNPSKDVGCKSCGTMLAESRGGKALIHATIVKTLS